MIRTLLAIIGLLALYKWYVVPWLDWDSLTQTYPEAVPVQNLTEQIPSSGAASSPSASPQPSAAPTPPSAPSNSPPSSSAPMPQPSQPTAPQVVPAEAIPPSPPNSEDFQWPQQSNPETMETFQWQGGENI